MKRVLQRLLAGLLVLSALLVPAALQAREPETASVPAWSRDREAAMKKEDWPVFLQEETDSVFKATPKASVTDEAGLFTAQEQNELQAQAKRISQTYDTDVWVYTSNESGFSDNYARDMLEYYGETEHPAGYIAYGINMADRSYWVDAYGDRERKIFTQSKTDGLADDAKSHLSDEEYFESAKAVLDGIETRLMIKTDPMGTVKKPLIYWKFTLLFFGLSLLGGGIIAGIWTAVRAGRHKDKKLAAGADAYASPLNLTERNDVFVSAYQTRVKIESSSSGHSGGGGSAGHTGSGGHF